MSINIQTKNGLKDILKDLFSRYEMSSDVIRTIEIPETEWIGTNAPYKQTVSIPEVTADNYVNIYPQEEITAEQYYAIMYANIEGSNQSEGSITLAAYGKKPAIALPLRFIISQNRAAAMKNPFMNGNSFSAPAGSTIRIAFSNPSSDPYICFFSAISSDGLAIESFLYGVENNWNATGNCFNIFVNQNLGLIGIPTDEFTIIIQKDMKFVLIPLIGRVPDIITITPQ